MLVGDFEGAGAGSGVGATAETGEGVSPGVAGVGSGSVAGTSPGAAGAGVWSGIIVGGVRGPAGSRGAAMIRSRTVSNDASGSGVEGELITISSPDVSLCTVSITLFPK